MYLKKRQAGFTLPEIMVAVALNFIILATLITVFTDNLNHYNKQLRTNRLYAQLQMALTIMANDIRRAGYWANANTDVGLALNNNPFMASGADISVNGSNNCILLTYDRNDNGSLPAISTSYDDERYGFRLQNNAVQARVPGAPFSCTAGATTWDNMTDTNLISVTNLSFTLNQTTLTTGPGVRGMLLRSVDISITGTLVSDTSTTLTLTQHVRLRNDKFIP